MPYKFDLNYLKNIFIDHLSEIHCDQFPWELRIIDNDGCRGIFARRDISINEIVFRDRNLVIGPRFGKNKIICVICFKETNRICLNGCGLPLCDFCNNSSKHKSECELIVKWQPAKLNEISYLIYNTLVCIRALILDDKSKILFKMLQENESSVQEILIDRFIKEFNGFPNDDLNIKNYLKSSFSIITTNGFEVPVLNSSVLGIYPLCGMLNHSCIPNARYTFDSNQILNVHAIRSIKKGEQIFISYTKPFLATPIRRILLKETKNFLCSCPRCTDPMEFNTNLAALKCMDEQCNGILLPNDPLNLTTKWKCTLCQNQHESKKIFTLQKFITNHTNTLMRNENLDKIIKYIETNLKQCLPESNQIVVEMKLFVIFKINNQQDEHELNNYLFKEKYCKDLIDLLHKLQLQESIKSGEIYFEWFKTRLEIKNSQNNIINDDDREMLQKSVNILQGSVAEPSDLKSFIQKYL